MKKTLTTLLLLLGQMGILPAQTPSDLVFNIQVTALDNATILNWNTLPNVTGYNVLRKTRSEKNFTVVASNLGASQTGYMDIMASKGLAYEYCVQSNTNNNISGYVYAGKELPAVHIAGEVLLVIDNTYKDLTELDVYKKDLIKEGWSVKQIWVNRNQTPTSVKTAISAAYNANPSGMKGVILLGHVPVPYSGNIAPDAHTDHVGAWPSDMFYADVTPSQSTIWNDALVQNLTAADFRNRNAIGDGKFDVSVKASNCCIKLFVGRIDVYNMPAINTDDVVLFKQYLNKNHNYRSGAKKFRQKGLVEDNFGTFGGEAFAQNGWRNFSNIVGANNVESGDYFTSMQNNSYIWSYACGGGTYTSAQGIGTTTDFKSTKVESVFTMLYGSYFGDWDNQNNFLRAPIASPSSTLVSVWGGRPNWFFHTMSLGEPVGYSYINSVENAGTYFPRGYYSGQVHQSLHGDPTLKMYVMEAPSGLVNNISDSHDKMYLNWSPSSEPGVLGYYVYKANTSNDEFTLLTPNYITTSEYVDNLNPVTYSPDAVYMVKAVKLEQTNSGSFYNVSPGIMSNSNINITLPLTLQSFNGKSNHNFTNTLFWHVSEEKNVMEYVLQRSENGQEFIDIATIQAYNNNMEENSYEYIDANPLEHNYYRLKIQDLNKTFSFSDIVRLSNVKTQVSTSVYPSPFTNQLHVNYFTEIQTNVQIQLTDMYGKIMYRGNHNVSVGNNTIDLQSLDHLAKGIYLIGIIEIENNQNVVVKVQKE